MMGRLQAAGRSSQKIWRILTAGIGRLETTDFSCMDITISAISFWDRRQTEPTYWVFLEDMTSRNDLWPICLGSLALKKAAASALKEEKADIGTVQSIPRISTKGIVSRRIPRNSFNSSREKLLYPGCRTSSESL